MGGELIAELTSVRWEHPRDAEFFVAIAGALRAIRAFAVEACIESSRSWLIVSDEGDAVASRREGVVATAFESVHRPKTGWPSAPQGDVARRVRADRRVTLPLPCRHTRASMRVWLRRTTLVGAKERGAWEPVASTIAMLLDAHVLVHRVARLSRSAHLDNRRLRHDLRQTLGMENETRSAAMRRCLERVDAVAPYDTPVLITGPSGAGKELIARRIAARSGRGAGPFITLNCGAVPEALAESELFGHERGAFTGAVRQHRGVFGRASGGTLLLDEVGELSLGTQVKLLRVLQEGTFTAVGSENEQRCDVRVLAATHRDLAVLVSQGKFREDLFYRLAVFEVAVPSLGQRLEDLPHLVRRILEKTCTRMGRAVPSVPRSVMRTLAEHDWPGNVRELENVLEGALVLSPGATLEVSLVARPSPRDGATAPRTQVKPLADSIRVAIEAALSASGGKIYGEGGAAQLLGLKPGTLQGKMRKLSIDRGAFVRS